MSIYNPQLSNMYNAYNYIHVCTLQYSIHWPDKSYAFGVAKPFPPRLLFVNVILVRFPPPGKAF